MVDGDYEEVENYLKDVHDVNYKIGDNAGGACIFVKNTAYVWIKKDSYNIETVCHEILHATLMIAEEVGLDLADQEALCYLYSYIINECGDILHIQMDPPCLA